MAEFGRDTSGPGGRLGHRVEVDGRPIRSWNYHRRDRTIHVRLPKGARTVKVTR